MRLTLYNITAIPAFDTNYIWLLQPDIESNLAWVIDPGDAAPVLAELNLQQLKLAGILVTHHHRDHIGGIATLVERFQIPVWGPKSEKILQVSDILTVNQRFKLNNITLETLAVPGHTLEHIAFFYPGSQQQPPFVFCGDALFAAGCGRRFEGDASTMWASLQRLATLPDNTLVYCAHEYTQANLQFALAMEPDNPEIPQRITIAAEQRLKCQPTLPSQIGIEKRTNPFLRCQLPQLKRSAEHYSGSSLGSPTEVFAALRMLKDNWPS